MPNSKIQGRSKEDQFIICLLKNESGVDCLGRITSAHLDWEYILRKAVAEGVFYPFYKNLLALDEKLKLIPDEFREKFRQTYYLHLAKSAEAACQIEQALGIIDSLKIKVLLFKGPAIDSLIYEGFFRPRLDLDFAVREEDMAAIEKALADSGYLPDEPEKNYPLPEYLNSKIFLNKTSGLIPLHIHRHLINNMFLSVDGALCIDMKKIWQEAELFKNYNFIYCLKPELNIFYLAEHGLKHDFDQLIFLYELDSLMRNYEKKFDWDKLLLLSNEFKLQRILYYGFYFTREILSSPMPDYVLEKLKPTRLSPGEAAFMHNILQGKYKRYSSYPVYLALRRGLIKKSSFLFKTIFPPGMPLQGYLKRLVKAAATAVIPIS